MKEFLIIGVTRPDFFPDEVERIISLFEKREIDFLHIRKPMASKEEVAELIKKIPREYYPFIKLHDHFDLVKEYSLGGVHLNSRNPETPEGLGAKSKSVHSLEEIDLVPDNLDYFFISPVFDSFSKVGYKANFDYNLLSEKIKGKRAVALGGVTPGKIPFLKKLGFTGCAMLGSFFPSDIGLEV